MSVSAPFRKKLRQVIDCYFTQSSDAIVLSHSLRIATSLASSLVLSHHITQAQTDNNVLQASNSALASRTI
ncbi:Uncharacterised protein [Yersinia frederiksenii]|nr:Uncharacterised protein [Yersinia frederiksenii]